MKLNTAQTLVLSYYGNGITNTSHAQIYGYKAPHAPQPTPPRAHRSRKHWDAQRFSIYRGSRPPVFGGRP